VRRAATVAMSECSSRHEPGAGRPDRATAAGSGTSRSRTLLGCRKPEGLKEAAVLVTVLLAVSPQPAMEQDGVQLMVAHDRDGTVVDQAADAGEDDAVAGPLPSSVD
jgi:hypothetical protein